VSKATRIQHGQNPSILDYIFTEEDELIENIEYLPPLAKSDNVCLALHYVLGELIREESFQKLNYWKADYDTVNTELSSVNWNAEFELRNCNQMWEFFREKIHTLVHQHVPIKKEKRNAQEKTIGLLKVL